MRTIFWWSMGDFLLYQKPIPAMLLLKKSIMQAFAANTLIGIFIEKIICKCFCHDRKAGLMLDF